MTYLITGGAGFIGSHLVQALLGRGDEVCVIDDLSSGTMGNLGDLLGHPRLTFHEESVLNQPAVQAIVERCRVGVIVHLAACVGVGLIVRRPLHSMVTNIRGTEIVLDAAHRAGARVLVASSSEIYGKSGAVPLREDSDRILGSTSKSRWSYATSKAVDEIFANAYWREHGVPTIVARLFNCAGPRQSGAHGMVIPRFVAQALRQEELTVHDDGEQRRCFCHVSDTVAALVALLDHPGSVGGVFNVGAQNEISIGELAGVIIAMTGSSSTVRHVPYDRAYESGFEDMRRRVPDTTKLQTLTGWRPVRSLHDILSDVIEHERSGMDHHRSPALSRPGPS